MEKDLSIIIPYYKTPELTKKLLGVLIPQLTDKVEVLIIDDGCFEMELDKYKSKNVHIWHLPSNSGGASHPRNIGLDFAIGEYITFIDSDDLVSEDYIETILKNLGKDIIFLSWKGKSVEIIMDKKPPKWNCSVWCRVYRRELIGDIRFDEKLKIAEDWVFNENIKYNTSKCIKKVVYYYNEGRPGSLINS